VRYLQAAVPLRSLLLDRNADVGRYEEFLFLDKEIEEV
jgi:hypothetical protein